MSEPAYKRIAREQKRKAGGSRSYLYGTPQNYPYYVVATATGTTKQTGRGGVSGSFKTKKAAAEYQQKLKPFGTKGLTYRLIDRRK